MEQQNKDDLERAYEILNRVKKGLKTGKDDLTDSEMLFLTGVMARIKTVQDLMSQIKSLALKELQPILDFFQNFDVIDQSDDDMVHTEVPEISETMELDR